MNILIVDDHEESIYLLETMLKAGGHDVLKAVNGAQAFEKLEAGGVELIISDILMPVMDGYQLCRNVKSDDAFRHIPFIIYTATYTGHQDEVFAMKIGANRFIQKPCEPEIFMKAVEDVMAAARRGDSASKPEPADEEEILKLYSERLVRKLEQKILQAEREIRARQEAEEALRISNTRLHLALASSNIGLWDWNLNTGEIWFSPEWKRQIGYDDHEIPNRYEEWEKRLHPQDRPHKLAEVDAYLQGRRPDYKVEFRFRHKNGSYRWIAASGKLIAGTDKKSRRFMGCHVDITERKRAEDERERLMAAIEQAGEIVFITDADGIIQYVNPVFETVTGYTYEEAVGKNPQMLLKSGKQDQAFYQNLWGTITAGKTWKGRMINKRKNGKLFTEEATISPVCDSAEKIVNYVAVKRDITDHLQLEAQLFQAQKMESVGRLAGGVAHDFSNMLNIIIGYSELALEKVESNDTLRADLEEILEAAYRSTNITRQLLAFSRQQTIVPKVLDLNDAIEKMLKMLERLIGEDIDLAWRSEKEVWPVKIDPSQVDQILANLCVNARDAINGVGKVTIETDNISFDEAYCEDHAGFVPGEYVLLAVSDNGSGIAPEKLGKIFEPFFTTKGLGKGTGLGLATVYGIVKQNNGFINVYSEPGNGTTIKIYLPRHASRDVDIYPESTLEVPTSRGEKVLFVEDDDSILELGRRMLVSLGYAVLTAASPAEAIVLARENPDPIHLLITDVVMPEMNGRELSKHLQSIYPDLNILFMSGYTADVIAHRGVLDEGVFFIPKPFSKKDLAVKVRQALDEANRKTRQ